jgi:hypothetical protein
MSGNDLSSATYSDQFKILVKEYGTSLLTSYSVIFHAHTSKTFRKIVS